MNVHLNITGYTPTDQLNMPDCLAALEVFTVNIPQVLTN